MPAPAPPCLMVNPGSFRVSRGNLAAQARALADRFDAEVLEVNQPGEIRSAMETLHARRQSRIFVLAGDGTVQGIVQYLALLPPGEWLPDLLFLAGGRSNTIALEFLRAPAMAALEAALRSSHESRELAVKAAHVLRVEQEGRHPQHGFLFVAAMLDSGVRLCRQHRLASSGWLHRGPLADPYRLAKLAGQVMIGRSPLPPYPHLRIATEAGEALAGPQRILMGTTLGRRHGLYNPFAARGAGAVRMTAVAADASRFWRRLPRLITGYFTDDMNPEDGYLSGCFQRIEVTGLAAYSLDGEAFDCDPTRPLVMCAGMQLRVLQP